MRAKSEVPQIFISYRTQDDAVRGLTSQLKELFENHFGGSIFLDREEIKGGDEWRKKIREALQCSRLLVLCIGKPKLWMTGSKTSIFEDGDWVREEIMTALDLGIPILPLLCYEGAELPREVLDKKEFDGLGEFQRHPLPEWTKEHMFALIRRMGELIHGSIPKPDASRLLGILKGLDDYTDLPENPEIVRLYFASADLDEKSSRLRADKKGRLVEPNSKSEKATTSNLEAAIWNLDNFQGWQLCKFAVGLSVKLLNRSAKADGAREEIVEWLQPWVDSEKIPGFTEARRKRWEECFRFDSPLRVQVILRFDPDAHKPEQRFKLGGSLWSFENEIPIKPEMCGSTFEAVFADLNRWLAERFHGLEIIELLHPRLECFADCSQISLPVETAWLGDKLLAQRFAVFHRLRERHVWRAKIGDDDENDEPVPDDPKWESVKRAHLKISRFPRHSDPTHFKVNCSDRFVLEFPQAEEVVRCWIDKPVVIGLWSRRDGSRVDYSVLDCLGEGSERRFLTDLPERLWEQRAGLDDPNSDWHSVALFFDRPDEKRLPHDSELQRLDDESVMDAASLL